MRKVGANKKQMGGPLDFLGGLEPFLQSGAISDFFSEADGASLGNAVEIGNLATSSFSDYFDADDPDAYVADITGQFSEQIAGNQVEGFLQNPTEAGLDQLGLSPRITKKIRRRIRKGKPVQRRFRDNVRRRQGALADQTAQSATDQASSIAGLLELLGSFSFEDGGDVSAKISKLVKEGKPRKQAVAIALDMNRRNKLKHGGDVKKKQQGGDVDDGEKPKIYVLGHEPEYKEIGADDLAQEIAAVEGFLANPGNADQEIIRENERHLEELRNIDLTVTGRDDTFRREFERKGGGKEVLSRDYDPVYISVDSGRLDEVLEDIPEGANIMFMDHSGDRMFGHPKEEFMDMLVEKRPNTCIGGTCYGQENFSRLKEDLPESTVILDSDAWQGFNASKRGMDAIVSSGDANLRVMLDSIRRDIPDTEVSTPDRAPNRRKGGEVSAKSVLGYSDGSPFSLLPEITIPGNTIDMSNTSKPLMLIPDKGNPKIAKPNSGIHKFPKASSVKEVPLFQLGGEVGITPIQAEKGEVAILPNLVVTKVRANKSHKQMDDDEITDIFFDGTFIGSIDKKKNITRKEAEDISFGYEALDYEEGKSGKIPEEVLLSDILFKDGEKEISEAEAIKRVAKKFNLTEREDDVFADLAISENKEARARYFEAVRYLDERKKTVDKPEQFQMGGQVGYTVPVKNQGVRSAAVPSFMDKTITGEEDPIEAQVGLSLDPGNIIQGILQFGTSLRQAKMAEQRFREDRATINQGAQTQRGLAGAGFLAGLQGLDQDPVSVTRDFEAERLLLEDLPTEIDPRILPISQQRASVATAPTRAAIFENTGNFSRAVNAIGQGVTAPTVSSLTDLAFRMALRNTQMRDARLRSLADLEGRISGQRFAEGENTRTGVNTLTAQRGQLGIGLTNALGTIEGNRVSNLLAARGAQFAANNQALANAFGGLSTVGSGFSFDTVDLGAGNPSSSRVGPGSSGDFDNFGGPGPGFGGINSGGTRITIGPNGEVQIG